MALRVSDRTIPIVNFHCGFAKKKVVGNNVTIEHAPL